MLVTRAVNEVFYMLPTYLFWPASYAATGARRGRLRFEPLHNFMHQQ